MLDGLKEALAAEAAERGNLASMRGRIERAEQDKASALAKRQTAVAKIAVGGTETEVAKIDAAIRVADSTIVALTEAADLAAGRVRDAEMATETILRSEMGRRRDAAQAEYDASVAGVDAALAARHLADQNLRTAQQSVALRPGNLRLMFYLRDA